MLLLVGAIGLLAGITGGMLAIGLLPTFPLESIIVRRSVRSAAGQRVAIPFPQPTAISAAVVDCFVLPPNASFPDVLARSERSGRGVALTSDGWVVTTRSAVRETRRLASLAVVSSDGVLHPVDRLAEDPASDLVFLHIDDRTAAVLPLAEDGELPTGTLLATPTVDGGLSAAAVRAYARDPRRPAVRSTDQWETSLAFDAASEIPPGSPLVGADGSLVGVAVDGSHAIPVSAIVSALPSLFSDGAVTRNAMRGTVRSDEALAVREEATRVNGVEIIAQKSGRAFPDGSALGSILLPGDRLLAVGTDPVTSRRPLPDLLQEYPAGATVAFRIRRGSAERDVEVPLERSRGFHVGRGDGDRG